MKLPKAEFDDLIKGPPDQAKEDKNGKYSSGVLFLAAEMGNNAFLGEVIRQYPHLLREVNDNNQTTFHVAVSHRHEGVFKLLDDMGSIKDLIITIEDKYGNNMLHLAGDRAMGDRPQKIPGEGLQLKLEVLWFKVHLSLQLRTILLYKNFILVIKRAGLVAQQIKKVLV